MAQGLMLRDQTSSAASSVAGAAALSPTNLSTSLEDKTKLMSLFDGCGNENQAVNNVQGLSILCRILREKLFTQKVAIKGFLFYLNHKIFLVETANSYALLDISGSSLDLTFLGSTPGRTAEGY